MTDTHKTDIRNLILVFGDQLTARAIPFDDFDREKDAVLMVEVTEEATYVPQHKKRLVLFFSAMRHFRDDLKSDGYRVHYAACDDPDNTGSFAEELKRWAARLQPEHLIVTKPGDHRVEKSITDTAAALDLPLEITDDPHFLCALDVFREHAEGRKSLVMETFYREMRRKHDYLMDGKEPVGGEWNFDKENRKSFGKDGPGDIPTPRAFAPDDLTGEVIELVEEHFADSPGTLEDFDYPVTRQQALQALDDFIEHRLPRFGDYQDAMVTSMPYLFHSRLSCVLNLHLLNPREVIDAAVAAYESGAAPINAVEGFVRQILGWREFVHGIYWLEMPGYAELNEFDADLPMPAFMWTGETEMQCIRQSVGQLAETAYAHHIQRLMVLGLFAMLLGVRPYDVHRWHMSMYADAIDWVSLPNVLGMSQYGDGGIMGSKPYAASGNYIDRMSDYCPDCPYNPKAATGDDACPFTTLYWDFLDRNNDRISQNHRMGLQLKNLDRKDTSEIEDIRDRAETLKASLTAETYLSE